ncbi:MAG: hypothetical protein KGM47_13525, partial [Acidobacteriota bacterium]|nr:hypothetical protein [Acidobacteriota bacterium]
MIRGRLTWFGFILLGALVFAGASPAFASAGVITYAIDLSHTASHLAGVTMTVPDAPPDTEIQFPAWNALYQIRDFIRNVQDLTATCSGAPLSLQPVDLYTFRTGSEGCTPLIVRYQVYAHEPGIFSSDLIPGHAFLNLAEILFYVPGRREIPVRARFNIPPSWMLVTLLPQEAGQFSAANYDALVDSPVEAGLFNLYSYSQGGAIYRIVVRGNPSEYSASKLIETVKAITAAETLLMRSRPFSQYTFIFHFPESGGGGGMEHSDGAAISFPAPLLATDWEELENTIAHEFFHLWNVKRIRPQGLVPVDY